MGLLPEPLADLLIARLMRMDGGQEQLPVFGGKVGWSFPNEVGNLAMGGQALLGFPSQRGEILLRERSSPMGESRRKFDQDFREGAVRLVRETGKPIAQVARDLGINEGTLGNWVNADRRRRDGGDGQLSEDERAELARLRRENAELAMERVL